MELLLVALDIAYQREAVPDVARLLPEVGVAVGVDVGAGVDVGVGVLVATGVEVAVGLGVGVFVATGVAVGLDVGVLVAAGVGVGVEVGEDVLIKACTSVMRACLEVFPATLTLPTMRKPLAEIGSPA